MSDEGSHEYNNISPTNNHESSQSVPVAESVDRVYPICPGTRYHLSMVPMPMTAASAA